MHTDDADREDPGFDDPEYSRWRDSAEDARSRALDLAAADAHNWVCFLCEQAAQLALKGLLHGVGAGARGHDLVALSQRLTEHVEDELPAEVSAALVRLSRHYTTSRYPDTLAGGTPHEHFTDEDAQQALRDVDRVLDFIDHYWRALHEN